MKRFIAAILVVVLAGSAFAADRSGPSEPSLASLPDLGSTDAARMFGDLQRRPLPGEGAPFGERPRYQGPRPYWENDPLFSPPAR